MRYGYRTADQVAAELNLSPRWLRRNAASLPHTRVGRSYVWDDNDIAALREHLRQRPSSTPSSSLRPVSRRAS